MRCTIDAEDDDDDDADANTCLFPRRWLGLYMVAVSEAMGGQSEADRIIGLLEACFGVGRSRPRADGVKPGQGGRIAGVQKRVWVQGAESHQTCTVSAGTAWSL